MSAAICLVRAYTSVPSGLIKVTRRRRRSHIYFDDAPDDDDDDDGDSSIETVAVAVASSANLGQPREPENTRALAPLSARVPTTIF